MSNKILLLTIVVLAIGAAIFFVFRDSGTYSNEHVSISLPAEWRVVEGPTPEIVSFISPDIAGSSSDDEECDVSSDCIDILTSGYRVGINVLPKGSWIPADNSEVTLDYLIASREEAKEKDPEIQYSVETVGNYEGILEMYINKENTVRYISFDTVKNGVVYKFGIAAPTNSNIESMQAIFREILGSLRLK